MDKKRLLFISHEASRSGAPILVLHLLQKLRQQNPNCVIDVLLLKGGELYDDFASVSDNVFLAYANITPSSFLQRNLRRLKSIIFAQKKETEQSEIAKIISTLFLNNYDLVYGNTIISLTWILPFYKKGIPTIIAIHELTYGIESIYKKEFIQENIINVSQIIAGSQAVANNLISKYGAKKNQVNVIHSFIDSDLKIAKEKDILKKELHILEDQLLIGIVSAQELRKGTDLVPMLVKQIKNKTNINFKFVNVGGTSNSTFVMNSKLDAEKLGVIDKIIYINHNNTPTDYINILDIFILLSREDPFPLVMLSAAKLKKTIVAFEKSGGAEEFLQHNNGVLIPYLDTDKMATEIVKLLRVKDLRQKLGEKIFERLENEYSEQKQTTKIFNLIDKLIN